MGAAHRSTVHFTDGWLSGCRRRQRLRAAMSGAPVELLKNAAEGLADLTFEIDAIARREGGGVAIIFHAMHDGQRVGMTVEIADDAPGALREVRVALIRSGPESDALLSAIADAFGEAEPRAQMVDRLELIGSASPIRPTNLPNGPTKLQLFYGGDEPFEW